VTYPVLQYNETDRQKIIFAINQIARGLNTSSSSSGGLPYDPAPTGTGDHTVASFPSLTINDGTIITYRSVGANTISNPDINAGNGVHTIVGQDVAGIKPHDIASAGVNVMLQWNAASSNWKLLYPGFSPVEQGQGIGQLGNKVFIGWSGSQLKCTVDTTDLGAFFFGTPATTGFTIYRASGGTDTAGLNAAIATLSANGGTVWCPDAVYLFATGPINVPKGVKIKGMQAGTVSGPSTGINGAGLVLSAGTEFRATASITSLFVFTDAPGSGVEDITITAPSAGVTITNVFAFAGSLPKHFTQCYFHRVSIQGFAGSASPFLGTILVGFAFGTNTTAQPVQFLIEDCIINNVTNGITGSNTAGAGGLTLDKVTFGGGTNGINTTGMGLNLINCYFQSQSGSGIIAVGKPTDMGIPFFACNTLVDSPGGDGWVLTDWANLEIYGGLNSSAGASGNGMTLTRITNFRLSVHIETAFAHGLRMVTCSKGAISNCVLNNNAAGAGGNNGTGDAISLSGCSGIAVTGCSAHCNVPGTTATGNQGYGLTCDATTQNILVSNCEFGPLVVGPPTFGNLGANGGQYSVNGSAAAIRITHRGTPFPDPTTLQNACPVAACPSSSFNVLNANVLTFGAPYAAGGSNQALVWSNGTNYTIIGA
jgi:hypothetical protein